MAETRDIWLVEDSQQIRSIVKSELSDLDIPYQFREFTGRQAVLDALEQRGDEASELILLLDGKLHPESATAEDALAIKQRIDELEIPTFIIGLSAERLADYDVSVDEDLTKDNLIRIGEVIAEHIEDAA